MASNFLLKRLKITINDAIFDFKEFYKFYKKIYEERGFFIDEKQFGKTSGKTETIKFYWECIKKADDYSKFFISSQLIFSFEKIIVLKDGKKKKMDKGGGTISFKSTLKTDYDSKWEENPIISFFKTIFENIFEKNSLKQYQSDLNQEVYDIENEVKSFFEMQKMR